MDQVSLGLNAARGYSANDLTSPARAAAAGALADTVLAAGRAEPFTELRIHGVSGSDGPTVLEHPDVLQVAGDDVTQFYRRWTPAAGPGSASRGR